MREYLNLIITGPNGEKMNQQVGELFFEIVEWAKASGADNIKDLPGCWEGDTGEYKVKINGHSEEVEAIPPYHACLMHNGWPVAIVGPAGGTVIPFNGSEDQELDFINHFKNLKQGPENE